VPERKTTDDAVIGKATRDNATRENAEDRHPFSNGYKSVAVVHSSIIRVFELNFNAVSYRITRYKRESTNFEKMKRATFKLS
jgi:hypothetical protein